MSAWLKRQLKFLIDKYYKTQTTNRQNKTGLQCVCVCIYEDSLVKQGRQESEELRMVNYETSKVQKSSGEPHS